MTSDIVAPLSLAASLVIVAALLCHAGLAAWRGWLELKRMEAGGPRRAAPQPEKIQDEEDSDTGVLIELASVKERLRRLEAIASGVDI